jgi:hypothetical protein
MAERTARFLGAAATATTVEAVGEAAVWSWQWRRSGTMRFQGTMVKAGRTAWFPGAVTAWRQSRWRQRGLDGVEEGAENFGCLTSSKSKSFS